MIIRQEHQGKTKKDLNNVCKYIVNPKKDNVNERCEMFGGFDCLYDLNNKDKIVSNFVEDLNYKHDQHLNNERKKSKKKKIYDHYEVSFSAEDWNNKTSQELLDIAKEAFSGFIQDFDDKDILFALHDDTELKHFHFIIPRVSNSLKYDKSFQSKNKARRMAERLEDKYNLVKTGRKNKAMLDNKTKLEDEIDIVLSQKSNNEKEYNGLKKKVLNNSNNKTSNKTSLSSFKKSEKDFKEDPYDYLKRVTNYAVKNASNTVHFLHLLNSCDIEIIPSFKKAKEGENATIRGYTYEYKGAKNKDGKPVVLSGSKINRSLLTKNNIDSSFPELIDILLGYDDIDEQTAELGFENENKPKNIAVFKPVEPLRAWKPKNSNTTFFYNKELNIKPKKPYSFKQDEEGTISYKEINYENILLSTKEQIKQDWNKVIIRTKSEDHVLLKIKTWKSEKEKNNSKFSVEDICISNDSFLKSVNIYELKEVLGDHALTEKEIEHVKNNLLNGKHSYKDINKIFNTVEKNNVLEYEKEVLNHINNGTIQKINEDIKIRPGFFIENINSKIEISTVDKIKLYNLVSVKNQEDVSIRNNFFKVNDFISNEVFENKLKEEKENKIKEQKRKQAEYAFNKRENEKKAFEEHIKNEMSKVEDVYYSNKKGTKTPFPEAPVSVCVEFLKNGDFNYLLNNSTNKDEINFRVATKRYVSSGISIDKYKNTKKLQNKIDKPF